MILDRKFNMDETKRQDNRIPLMVLRGIQWTRTEAGVIHTGTQRYVKDEKILVNWRRELPDELTSVSRCSALSWRPPPAVSSREHDCQDSWINRPDSDN